MEKIAGEEGCFVAAMQTTSHGLSEIILLAILLLDRGLALRGSVCPGQLLTSSRKDFTIRVQVTMRRHLLKLGTMKQGKS